MTSSLSTIEHLAAACAAVAEARRDFQAARGFDRNLKRGKFAIALERKRRSAENL